MDGCFTVSGAVIRTGADRFPVLPYPEFANDCRMGLILVSVFYERLSENSFIKSDLSPDARATMTLVLVRKIVGFGP